MAAHRYTCVGFSPKADRKRIDFLNPMPNQRVCSVCSVIPDVAFSLGCRHVFCTACMNELMRNSPVAVCPFDDKEFRNVSVSWDSASEGYVGSRKSYCLNRAFGCTYVGRMSEMIEHYYRECDYHVVYCGCCAKPVARVNVLVHLREGCGVGILTSENAFLSATAFDDDADKCLSAARNNITNFINRTMRKVSAVENRTQGSSDVTDVLRVGSEAASSRHAETTSDTTQMNQIKMNLEPMVFSTRIDDALTTFFPRTLGPAVNNVVTAADLHTALLLVTKTDSTQTDPTDEWPFFEQMASSQKSEDSLHSWVPDSAYHSSASGCETTDGNPEPVSLKPKSILAVSEAPPEPIKQSLLTYEWDIRPFRKYRNPPWPEFKSEVLTVGERGYRLRLEGKFKFLNYPARFLALYVKIQKGPDDESLEWPFRRRCSFLLMHARYEQRDILFTLEDHVNVEKLPRAHRLRIERPKTAENFAIGVEQCVAAQQMVEGGFVYKNAFRIRFIVE
ncbi:uncharacterized protein LOC142592699 [Dermacentor variabilis]|uniref:uncharacterized protein LOC142592699 n=1 Tax=Dermacentor variabilis TaxID=34621 RepID=UPI003F5B0512